MIRFKLLNTIPYYPILTGSAKRLREYRAVMNERKRARRKRVRG